MGERTEIRENVKKQIDDDKKMRKRGKKRVRVKNRPFYVNLKLIFFFLMIGAGVSYYLGYVTIPPEIEKVVINIYDMLPKEKINKYYQVAKADFEKKERPFPVKISEEKPESIEVIAQEMKDKIGKSEGSFFDFLEKKKKASKEI